MSGGLQLFAPPDGAGPEFVRDVYDAMLSRNRRPTDVP